MKRLSRVFAVVAVLGAPLHAEDRLAPAARAFMADYARDIVKGDRTALAGRYDPDGAFLLLAGNVEFATRRQIADDYVKRWEPPGSFEWRDLHFASAGPDVVVEGRFIWSGGNGSETFAYVALLRRRHGKLFIRVEEETPVPSQGH